MLSPTPDGELIGKAEVKAIFDIGKVGKVCGCGVTSGVIKRSGQVRVMRGDTILHMGNIKTLKSFKLDVNEVKSGSECGINLHEWEDIAVGDVLECYSGGGSKDIAESSSSSGGKKKGDGDSGVDSSKEKTKVRKKRRKRVENKT
jgi:translation initiation factor IF-2